MNQRTKDALIRFMGDRKELDVPGNSLLIYHKDKEIFRHYTEGVNKDTIFRIYSMTKVITVTAALQLFEQGLFTMNDPLEKFLPEFHNSMVWDEAEEKAVPADGPILMRHLFSMSAGITYDGDGCETAQRIAKIHNELREQFPGESYTTQQFIRRLSEAPLAFHPGSHWNYSLCHDILGAVIEVISGQSFGEYLKEHIFEPLGMNSTFFRCPEGCQARMAPKKGAGFPDDMFQEKAVYESGGGGLLSTLDDYMIFANTLTRGGTSKNGVRILGRKTIELMRLDQLNEEQKKDFNWSYLKGYSYGLGVRTLIDPAKAAIPGSIHEFGWCGVLGTWVLMDPEEELTVVYMHQSFPNLEEYVQTHLRAIIYGGL